MFGLRGVTKSNEFQKLELTTLWCMDLEDNNPQSGVVILRLSEHILILVFLLLGGGGGVEYAVALSESFLRLPVAW